MCGRGGHSTCHPGNLRFRQLISMYRERYLRAGRTGKSNVAMEVLQQWRCQNPPGRLLKRSDPALGDASPWNDVGDTEARRKVAQTLREKERNPSMDPSYLPSALVSTSVGPSSSIVPNNGAAVPPNQYVVASHSVNASVPSQENPLQFFAPLHHAAQQSQPSQVPIPTPLSLPIQVFSQNPLASKMTAPVVSRPMAVPPSTIHAGTVQQQQPQVTTDTSYIQAVVEAFLLAARTAPPSNGAQQQPQPQPTANAPVDDQPRHQEAATIVSLSSYDSGSQKRPRQDTTTTTGDSSGPPQELDDVLRQSMGGKSRRRKKSKKSSAKDQSKRRQKRKCSASPSRSSTRRKSSGRLEGLSVATHDMFNEEYFHLNLNMADYVDGGPTDEELMNRCVHSLAPDDDLE